jgi:putative pyruvate formate lyase activating enzyme
MTMRAPMNGQDCTACPRCCHADRTRTTGFCGIGSKPVLAKACVHVWEEPCISGTRGSGTVFFSGCSLRCVFCQNRSISRGGVGWEVETPQLADIFLELQEKGVHNINLVNPSHQAESIAEALHLCSGRLEVPAVWNSGGYDTVETVHAMPDRISIWLPDLKFHDAALSKEMACAPDYFDFASAAILAMLRKTGDPAFDGQGMMRSGVMIRHLVLPGHTRDSIRILEWIAAECGSSVLVSLMGQYTPMPDAPGAPGRRLTRREYDRVTESLFRLGLDNGYVQELSAAGMERIPDFDGEGLPGFLQTMEKRGISYEGLPGAGDSAAH